MADRPTRIGGLGIGADQVGSQITDLARKVNAITAQLKSDQFLGVSLPEVDQSFAPLFEGSGKEIFVTLAYFIPGYSTALKTIIVKRAAMVSNAAYKQQRIKDTFDDISDDDRALGRIERRFQDPLKPNLQYDVIRLNAFDQLGNSHYNPEDEPKFANYPGNILFTFTTPSQVSDANAPSKPTLARIIQNFVDPNSDGSQSIVILRIYADETQALTFQAQRTVTVQPKILDDAGLKAPSPSASIEDPALTFVDVSVGGLVTGRNYAWTKNTAFDESGAGAPALATSTVRFVAGGFADPADGLAGLTLVSTSAIATEDPAQLLVTFVLNQPNPAYKLKNYTAKRKKDGNPDSDYDLPKNIIVYREDLHDPIYSTPGNITLTFLSNVKPAATYLFKITVRSIQLFTKDFTSGTISASSLTLPAAATAAAGGPSYVNGGGMRASIKDYSDTFAPPGAAGDSKYLGQRWETFANSAVLIDNLGPGGGGSLDADGVDWVSTQARLLLDTSIVTRGGRPAVMLGKILSASEDWSGNLLMIANGADVNVNIAMAFVNGSGDICSTPSVAFTVSHLEYIPFFFILLVPPTFVRNGKEWLELRLAANPAQKIWTTQWQLEPGIAYHFWKMNQTEAQVQPTTNPADTGQGMVTHLPTVVTDDGGGVYGRLGILSGRIDLL